MGTLSEENTTLNFVVIVMKNSRFRFRQQHFKLQYQYMIWTKKVNTHCNYNQNVTSTNLMFYHKQEIHHQIHQGSENSDPSSGFCAKQPHPFAHLDLPSAAVSRMFSGRGALDIPSPRRDDGVSPFHQVFFFGGGLGKALDGIYSLS